ncbi:MAG: serine/threonine protein kinase [Polyangiaceae bacterium]|nr:serine/threonine protein kinase [Polyangiaceae bacterium]MCE7889311.1 serine/threonine protein kinase [Sorangiineae bacterium PRO1]MCL4755852.1 serine/threonine protein kinase [Myxococcales bacterium]
MPRRIGQVVSDRYVLAELIGKGGHSVVYRALDRKGGPNVAVKVLQDEFAGNEEYSVRLVREHRVMTLLAGTAAVPVRGLATSPDGAVCLVMELLRGKDLDDLLAEMATEGRRMGVRSLVELLCPIVDTLEKAHALGIIHRDIKPGNVYVLSSDPVDVRLIDFGLAKLDNARPLTRGGMIMGSPSYIAPEVWKGDSRILDHRMDVYSFGAIVFRALGGRVPFDAPNIMDKVELITKAPRPSLFALRDDLPAGIDAWVEQVLAIEPDQRFRKIRAAWNALLDTLDFRRTYERDEPSASAR